ncbi:MAG TPA: glycosyltransferase [Candidatus Acidoferrales bacterium]|nr:glycosyltransferase [Candidatus Acidoferrales bacterium]
MQRLEFVYHDAGGGHRAAATALEMAIKSQQRPWEVKLLHLQTILEPLDILQKYGRIRIQEFYNAMLRNGWTLGSAQLLKVLQFVIRAYHEPGVRLLEAHWKETQPDMLVSFIPHFNATLCDSYARAFPERPFVTVLTDIADYPPHFWIEPASPTGGRQKQYFICGSDRAVEQARSMGHPDDRIFRASGMILNPKFYDTPAVDRIAERQKLGLRPDLPTGLVLFGGYGSKVMLEIAERIEQSRLDVQLIYICGKNEKIAAALRAQKSRLPRFIEGFTTRVNEYMQIADFFIGKPGPGSVNEALAIKLPVIVECNAWTLPQERYNAEWIVEKQVGIVLRNFRKIDEAVARLIEPAALARYRANAAAINNRAVFEIPGFLEQILERSRGAVANVNSNELLAQKPC